MHNTPSKLPSSQPPPKQPRSYKAVFYQAVFVAFIIGIGWLLISTLLDNLERQGIVTGFDFLQSTAGFGVIFSLIDYTEADSYGRVFWVGLANTLLVAVLGILFSTALGFTLGIARLSHNFLARNIASAYIGIFRNIPLLLHLFFWYFAVLRPLPGPKQSINLLDTFFINNRGLYLPNFIANESTEIWQIFFGLALLLILLTLLRKKLSRLIPLTVPETIKNKFGLFVFVFLCFAAALLTWILGQPYDLEIPRLSRFNFTGGIVVIPELVALVLALSLYTAAYIAEIVRAGIESVPKGQIEAAQSLGLSPKQSLVHVIIPQALRLIIPPLTNQYLNLTKNSSLAAAIAYPDLVSIFAGTVLNQTGQAVEIIAITMLVYLFLSLSISFLMSLYEKQKTWSQTS